MTLIQKMQALAGSAVLVSAVATCVSYSTSLLDIKKEEEAINKEQIAINKFKESLKNPKNESYGGWTFSDWASGNEASNSGWF